MKSIRFEDEEISKEEYEKAIFEALSPWSKAITNNLDKLMLEGLKALSNRKKKKIRKWIIKAILKSKSTVEKIH